MLLRNIVKIIGHTFRKGKGLIIGKLRTAQLVEADCFGFRNDNSIENYRRISQYNYCSRKNNFIEIATLEKMHV